MSRRARSPSSDREQAAASRRRLPWVALALVLVVAGALAWYGSTSWFGPSTPPTDDRPADGASQPPWFRDVTEEVGLDFVHDAGPVGSYFMPQIMGSGAALLDFDRDGRLDLYLLQGAGPNSSSRNRLYRQGEDGRFHHVKDSGLEVAGYCTGVAVGDVNNDGWPDVVVTQYGGIKLFLNNHGTFTDVTRQAGLDSALWGMSAAFLDYDRDGWLDLIVVNYSQYNPATLCYGPEGKRDYCHPRQFPGSPTLLFHNLGRQAAGDGMAPAPVAFRDVTEASGLGRLREPGLGVACADFDGDGWPDILVANDGRPNHLWINRHDGTFQEEALARGLAYTGMGRTAANMGIALGDVNGDGLFDVFVTHLASEMHTLWLQGPRGLFRDRTAWAGLAPPGSRGTGFGTVLTDFDLDGALDAAVVNGGVLRGRPRDPQRLGPFWSEYAERNQLFANTGDGRFRDVSGSTPAFCGRAGVYRGLACGDVFNTGGQDLLVTAVGGPARLYRNTAPRRGHWLLVRALDPILKRDAYGAEVVVESGQRRWLRRIDPGSSYLCSGDPRAHFGLGDVVRVERIRVRWPHGRGEVFRCEGVDRLLTLVKGKGDPVE